MERKADEARDVSINAAHEVQAARERLVAVDPEPARGGPHGRRDTQKAIDDSVSKSVADLRSGGRQTYNDLLRQRGEHGEQRLQAGTIS